MSVPLRRLRRLVFAGFAAVLLGAAAFVAMAWHEAPNPAQVDAAPSRLPLAILGDSDSHAFHDEIAFGRHPALRGGAYRATTFNWPEVLGRLRADRIDLGPWGTWGNSHASYALLRGALGLAERAPRKEDYAWNFALSGARCADLAHGRARQLPALLGVLDAAPAKWRHGLVVIRIGVNDFGTAQPLDALARDPADPAVTAVMDACVDAITDAVEAIHARHPDLRFVLVGIYDNAHWAKYLERWQDPVALRNIATGLDHFDAALAALAAADPAHRLFFSDRAFTRTTIGGRDAAGRPAYRDIVLPDGTRVGNSLGDSPDHLTVADGHAGTVLNALWAGALIRAIDAHFGLDLQPIGLDEAARLIAPALTRQEAIAPGMESLERSAP